MLMTAPVRSRLLLWVRDCATWRSKEVPEWPGFQHKSCRCPCDAGPVEIDDACRVAAIWRCAHNGDRWLWLYQALDDFLIERGKLADLILQNFSDVIFPEFAEVIETDKTFIVPLGSALLDEFEKRRPNQPRHHFRRAATSVSYRPGR